LRPCPRRLDEERPARIGPNAEAVANVNDFTLSPHEFTTWTGGLFLFVPDLVRLDGEAMARGAKLPGSRIIPAADALRASLALKLWAIERKSHIMCRIWYSISRTVSDDDAHRRRHDDRSHRAFAVKPRAYGAPQKRHWGLTARRGRAIPVTVPPMPSPRCSG
jgi:hypothetical protein